MHPRPAFSAAGRLAAALLVAGATVSACDGPAAGQSGGGTPSRCQPTPGTHGEGSPGAGPVRNGRVVLGPGMSLRPSPELIGKTEGQPLRIAGMVTDERCRPLSGATLELWQTNAQGEYGPGHGTSEMRCCYLQGAVLTDAAGRYEVETIMPGHYRGEAPPPPAHIHVWVSHPSAQTLSAELDFAGDPSLPGDAKAVLHLDHIAGRLHGTFVFVLTDR